MGPTVGRRHLPASQNRSGNILKGLFVLLLIFYYVVFMPRKDYMGHVSYDP